MNKQNTTILLFLPFFIWWCRVNLYNTQGTLLVEDLYLAPILYVAFSSLVLVSKKKLSPKKPRAVNLLLLWLLLDVLVEYLGNTFMFELRLLSLPLHFLLSMGVVAAFFPEEGRLTSVSGSALLVLSIFSIAFIFSGVSLHPGFDIYRFLIIYLPLYRTSAVVLIFLMAQGNGLEGNILWKLSLGVCQMFKLVADLVFIEGFLVGSGLAPDSYIFLTLVGSLFFILSLVWLLEFPLSVFNLSGDGITYFRNVSRKIPINLN